MRFFRKKSTPDVIDLTKLQDKGILQRSKKIAQQNNAYKSKDGIVDLSPSNPSNTPETSTPNMDFLSNLATANSVSTPSSDSVVDNLKGARTTRLAELNQLKLKIDDMEYKIDNFIKRLDNIEEKLGRI